MSAYFIYYYLTTSPFRLFYVTQFLVSCSLFYYLVSLNRTTGTSHYHMDEKLKYDRHKQTMVQSV